MRSRFRKTNPRYRKRPRLVVNHAEPFCNSGLRRTPQRRFKKTNPKRRSPLEHPLKANNSEKSNIRNPKSKRFPQPDIKPALPRFPRPLLANAIVQAYAQPFLHVEKVAQAAAVVGF